MKALGLNTRDSLLQIINGDFSDEEKVDAHLGLAKYYTKTESAAESYTQIFKGQQLARDINYYKGLGKLNYLLVSNNPEFISLDSQIYLLDEAKESFLLASMPKEEAKALNQLGILYERQGQYRLAMNHYYESLFIFQDLNDLEGIANQKNNIGLIHQLQKHYASANYFFRQCIEAGKELHNNGILANAYNNLAICYQEQNQLKQALHYFELVYEIDRVSQKPENLASTYNNIGVVQTDLGNYTEAKYYLFRALQTKRSIDQYTDVSNTLNNLASVYLKTGKLDSATYFIQQAIHEAKVENAFPNLYEAYTLNSEVLEKKGDFEQALKYRKMGNKLQDSLSFSENSQVLSLMENEYQRLKNEKQEVEASAEADKVSLRKGIYFLVLLLLACLFAFLVYYVLKVRHAYKHLQVKQKKIEVQNKILQVKNIEVMQAKEAAEEAANIKTQFISTISHEIRTPLNAIIGVTNLLQTGNPREEQLDNLNILKISSENLLQLVNNILDFSKMEAGKLQLEVIDFNLRSLVYDVKDLFSIKAMEKGIELLVNFDEKIPSVLKGDPLRINQLLINLVNNAIKFTDHGYVKIDVSIQLATINHALVHFSVSDTGIGIPQSKQSQIFQSFTQADSNTTRKFGGTGLGLSICKRILENLNSKLQLESVVGKGSKFYFTINFEASRNASLGKSARTASFEDSIQGKRVLVVEDNMMNIMVIRQFLQKWGVITEIALNGREGYKRLQEANFDAILMDIHMPEMDGIEATILIRKMTDERKRNVPIIALTAENEMQFRQKVYEVGMNDYIFKPFNPDDLRERLGYALYNNGNYKYHPR